MPPLVAVVLSASQRRYGRRRTLAAAVLGHVGATVATSAILAPAVRRGWIADRESRRLDVGASYALAAVAGLVAGGLGRPWSRCCTVAVSTALVGALAHNRGITDAGHLIAWGQGLLLGRRFRAR